MSEVTKVTTTLTMEVEVDPGWIEFITGGPEGMCDVFLSPSYCGYWMEGIEHDPKLGWLAYEFSRLDRHCSRSERTRAIMAWKEGTKLPEYFHALDLEAAKKSWVEGIKQYGMDWFENGDGNTYDFVVQKTLLGELVYS